MPDFKPFVAPEENRPEFTFGQRTIRFRISTIPRWLGTG